MEHRNPRLEPAQILCILLPRFNLLTLTGFTEPARIANYLSSKPIFTTSFHSAEGDIITSSNGFDVPCAPLPEQVGRHDVIAVFGSWGSEHYRHPSLFSWLRKHARAGVPICGIEIGPYIMARAELLSGKQATVHWSYLSGFQEEFPDIDAVEQLYTVEGRAMTCSGGTAVIDLMLYLIEQSHGASLAGEVSDQMMHHPVRPADLQQRVTLGRGIDSLPDEIRMAVTLIETHISEPLTVPEIAQRIGVSQRQLIRLFNKSMGCSVVQFGLLLRLQHARVLLVTTGLSIREIATASGFNSLSHFAYAFKKCFGKRPRDYRQAWPEQEAEPHWPGTLARYLETLHTTQNS